MQQGIRIGNTAIVNAIKNRPALNAVGFQEKKVRLVDMTSFFVAIRGYAVAFDGIRSMMYVVHVHVHVLIHRHCSDNYVYLSLLYYGIGGKI